MPFSKDFLWGGATAANQCEGGYNQGGRGLANVDLVPHGKDRFPIITGEMKHLEFDEEHFYQQKKRLICIIIGKKTSHFLLKWDLKPIECLLLGQEFSKRRRTRAK